MPRGSGGGGKDKQPPSITITSPVNGATIAPNTPFTITATASDNRGIANVTFVFNGRDIGSDYSSPYSVTATTPNALSYSTTITAIAFDTSGNSSSHTITISGGAITTTTTSTPPPPPPTLPSSFALQTPTAFSQGGEGSCAAHAAALMYSIDKYYTTGATSYSQSTNIYSPEWIFNISHNANPPGSWTCIDPNDCSTCSPNFTPDSFGCGAGSTVIFNLFIIHNTGVPRWSVCPYDPSNGCSSSDFTQAMKDEAASNGTKCTIKKLVLVPITDRYQVKRMLRNGHAGGAGFQYDFADFYYGDCNTIWRNYGTTPSASHAVTIIGYDDTKNAWLIQNSWGTSWGCNGKLWIDYNFAETIMGDIRFFTSRSDQNFFPIL